MNHIQIASLLFFSCFVTAISRITLKHGMSSSNAITGMVFSLVFGWLTLLVLFLGSYAEQTYTLQGVLFFCALGVVAPPVVRYFTYIGVEKLGPSRSDPIRSLTPLFAVVFAFIFFNEPFSPLAILSCLLIVFGTQLLSKDMTSPQGQTFVTKYYFFLFPFIAAVLAGIISNLRKLGMSYEITPLTAAFCSATSALIVFGSFLLYKKNFTRLTFDKSSLKYFIFTGVLVSITDIIDLVALKQTKVSYAAPLLASTPLFVILLSSIFLKKIETITKTLVIGAVFIFIGVLLVTVKGGP